MTDVPTVRVVPLLDGPFQVSGPLEIVRPDGVSLEPPGPDVYLCRCGRSQTKPFCDGAHARTGWREAC
ncbi:MAG TPA: CDGSH iron-sulfur domain-containing protein [Capillimicrobium sp.]